MKVPLQQIRPESEWQVEDSGSEEFSRCLVQGDYPLMKNLINI